jgi:Flp pilus assembly protein TadG
MKTRARTHDRHIGARRCRGLATIEFAICAPLLFLLLLATAEMGRFLYQYNTLVKAVRDGARYAAAHTSDNNTTRIVSISTQLRDQTRNLVVTGNVAGSGTPLLPRLTPQQVTVEATGAGFIRVAVSNFTFTPVLGSTLPTIGFGDSISLTMPLAATVQMRALL